MESNHSPKLPMTPVQKRLLRLVIGLGAVLVVMFVFALGAILYQLAHLHGSGLR